MRLQLIQCRRVSPGDLWNARLENRVYAIVIAANCLAPLMLRRRAATTAVGYSLRRRRLKAAAVSVDIGVVSDGSLR